MNNSDTKKTTAAHAEAPSHVQTLVLVIATGLGIYLCYLMTAPFLPALTAALALAVLFTPMQRWFEKKLKRPNLAAFISIVLIALIVVVPMVFVGQRLVLQAAKGAELVQTKVSSGEWRQLLEAQPRVAPILRKIDQQLNLPETVKDLTTGFSATAGSIVKGSVFQIIGVVLTFYLLFFFLRDGRHALKSLGSLLPLSKDEISQMFSRVHDTVFASIYGTLAVSSVQGFLGGLMFWFLGLSAPLLWGVVMAVLAVVPVLGAFVVWVPAVVFLALEGSWGKALILLLWGLLVVGTIDNLLRPILVGNRLKLHTVPVFISVVGGLVVFGPSGLILGPMVLTITMVLLEIWTERSTPKPAAIIQLD
ncbi:MAG: AI-2E family transporter [Arenimonas sp.]